MKNRILKYSFFFFALFVLQTLSAQPTAMQDSVAQAAKYYNAGKFKEAIRTYENVLSRGMDSPLLYFNLGNAYYKSGNTTLAILNFERAKKICAQ